MPKNVEPLHRLQYANSVTMVAQMTKSPLFGAVTEVAAKGDAQSVTDLMGKGEYQIGEDYSHQNPSNRPETNRRWVMRPLVIESGDHIYKEDEFDTATDLTSHHVTFHTNNVLRGKHDRILGVSMQEGKLLVTEGGILGRAVEGKRAGSNVDLPGSQYVPAGTTGMTTAKLRDAVLALRKEEFGMEDDDQLYCLIAPEQVDDLLGIAAESSAALNAFAIEQLKLGKPTSLLGMNWLISNRVPFSKTDATVRLCPVFSKKNIQVGVWQDIKGDMWNNGASKNRPYCYVSGYWDAVRIQDKGVVVIECKQS